MPKRKINRMDVQTDSAASQNENESYDDSHHEPAEVNVAQTIVAAKTNNFQADA